VFIRLGTLLGVHFGGVVKEYWRLRATIFVANLFLHGDGEENEQELEQD
jgi:hypothetical protein